MISMISIVLLMIIMHHWSHGDGLYDYHVINIILIIVIKYIIVYILNIYGMRWFNKEPLSSNRRNSQANEQLEEY